MLSGLGIVENPAHVTGSSLRHEDSVLVLLGAPEAPLGGSVFARRAGITGAEVPDTDCAANFAVYKAYAAARDAGLVLSAHDVSEGGLAVTLAEMGFSLKAGMEIELPVAGDAATALFHEGTGRLVVEVAADSLDAIRARFAGLPLVVLGRATADHRKLVIRGGGAVLIDAELAGTQGHLGQPAGGVLLSWITSRASGRRRCAGRFRARRLRRGSG